MGVSALPHESQASSSGGTTAVPDDSAPVRTAAQWLVVAAGAVGAAMVAGLQLSDVGKLAGNPVQLAFAAMMFVAALTVVGRVIARASAVLVIRRITVSDLRAAETAEQVRGTGIKLVSEAARDSPPRDPVTWIPRQFDKLKHRFQQPRVSRESLTHLQPILGQIRANREWLFVTEEMTASELSEAYLQAVHEARNGDPAATALAADLERRLATLCSFVRAELTRTAYRRLSTTITGWHGWLFTGALALFALTLSWPITEAPAVKSPYRLDIVLTGSAADLHDAGLPPGCRPSTRLTAVALAGTTTEPLVVTDAQGSCPAARFTVTDDVGVPLPLTK
jgi:hypothetical protein